MISIQTENVIKATKAAQKQGVHVSTWVRWAKKGCKASDGARIYPETFTANGTIYTSMEALQRFIDRLSSPTDVPDSASMTAGPPASQKREIAEAARQERVSQQLTLMGV